MSTSYLDIQAISHPIPPQKQAAKRHYGSHPYFTKRAWNVVQEYIRTFAPNKGDVVLDPFGGSGITAVEALVLRRKAVHVDINPLANFLCRQVAIAPVGLSALSDAFAEIEKHCKPQIIRLREMSLSELQNEPIPYWYPQGVKLPKDADVEYVEELFTRRQLIALSILHHHIQAVKDEMLRDLLLFAFSATLAKVNRTFVSAHNRAESRGGATIFSVYRYNVPDSPVELDVWEQFEMRFKRLLQAKKETNQLIGDYYREGDTIRIYKDSATRLSQFIEPESVDYIYTDPPYGAHIAYLGLSTMWNAWLGFPVTEEDYQLEAIEGGDLDKSKAEYESLLRESINEMFKVLKFDRWLSIVFVHKDPSYWDAIVKSAQETGFEYHNTVVQPVGVVWSMHKKKNPLTVLSGELVLNFRKVRRPKTIAISHIGGDVVKLIKNSAELTIVRNNGAMTEQIYHDLIPTLLENGLLGEVKTKLADITPLLREEFEFDETRKMWNLKSNTQVGSFVPLADRVKFYVIDYLRKVEKQGRQATFDDIVFNVMPNLINGVTPSSQTILEELKKIAYSPDGMHWQLKAPSGQISLNLLTIKEEPSIYSSDPPTGREHDRIIYRLITLAKQIGLVPYLGKREQSNPYFKEVSWIKQLPLQVAKKEQQKRIEQIDCIWFYPNGAPAFAFEVEDSTPIVTALQRFVSLMETYPKIGEDRRLIILVPQSRKKKLIQELTTSVYIGHPLFIENKVRYAFYEVFINTIKKLLNGTTTLDEIDLLFVSPKVS